MLLLSAPSISDDLSLDETIERLAQSALVDGIAEFGSRAGQQVGGASDYDLLILVTHIPVRVFQMVTTIHRRLADIVLVETETADTLLATGERPTTRFESLFARKMQAASIRYDRSGRLARVQCLVTSPQWEAARNDTVPAETLYNIWFWQSFGLLQLERMAKSQDPLHRSAVDMMFSACLSGTWRGYFELRALAWDGEKAALRYWGRHDPGYLKLVKACLERANRDDRLAAYRNLVQRTLEPIGNALRAGETAVVLAQAWSGPTDIQTALDYWNGLFVS